MSKKIVELSTKRKVEICEMSIDDVDYCNDLLSVTTESDNTVLRGMNKARTAWLRKGIVGGDFKTKIDGSVPDSVLKELSEDEKNELIGIIQEYQQLGE
tara:strand:- start:865 stop:1161 length:297 start_codon:yes stop_codon:yes gene_type:complete